MKIHRRTVLEKHIPIHLQCFSNCNHCHALFVIYFVAKR